MILDARELIARKRYDEALQWIRSGLRSRPGDHELLMQLAEVYENLGERDKALRIFTHLADRAAAEGAAARAIAILKKIYRMDSSQSRIFETVAGRIRDETEQPIEPFTLPEDDAQLTSATGVDRFGAGAMRVVEDDAVVDETIPSPLFESFSRDELLAVIRGLELQLFDPGDIIVMEGDPGDSLFILTSGILKAFVREGEKSYRQVRTMHEGDFFGEISILGGGARTATVTAATRCELLELDRATLDAITAMHPKVPEILRRFYEERIGNAGPPETTPHV